VRVLSCPEFPTQKQSTIDDVVETISQPFAQEAKSPFSPLMQVLAGAEQPIAQFQFLQQIAHMDMGIYRRDPSTVCRLHVGNTRIPVSDAMPQSIQLVDRWTCVAISVLG
jgi:hypothetical protein